MFGGNSAGDAVQSRDMINGYYGSNGPAESLQQGAVQVCYDSGPDRLRGRPPVRLPEPHHRPARVRVRPHRPLAQRRRLDDREARPGHGRRDRRRRHRLHASCATSPATRWATSSTPTRTRARRRAAAPTTPSRTRNVAVHLLPAGSGFDFGTMTPSQDGTPHREAGHRGPDLPGVHDPATAIRCTSRAGSSRDPAGLVGDAFVADAGGPTARIVVLAAGYAKSGDAQADAKAIAAALAPSVASVSWFVARLAHEDRRRGRRDRRRDRHHRHRAATARSCSASCRSPAWAAARVALGHGGVAAARRRCRGRRGRRAVRRQAPRRGRRGRRDRGRHRGQRDARRGLGLVAGLAVEPRLLPDQLWPQLFQIAAGVRARRASPPASTSGTALRVQGGAAIRGRRQRGRRRRRPLASGRRATTAPSGRLARPRHASSTGTPSRRRARAAARPSAARRHHRERQRQPAALLGPDVTVAGPPVHRVLGHALEPEPRAEQRRDDLAQRPGPGELPVLVVLGDRQPVDVLGRPALRRLGAAEVVVVGQRSSRRPRRRRTATPPDGRRRSRGARPGRGAAGAPPPSGRGPGAR